MFLILIGVALFAALSYAVTRSGSGGGNADKEKETLRIAQLMQYAAAVQQAVNRLMLVNGCTEDTLEFWVPAPLMPAGWSNANAPADESCDVFQPNGGGVSFHVADAEDIANGNNTTKHYAVSGHFAFSGVGSDSNADIVLSARVSFSMCKAINQQLGIDTSAMINGVDSEAPYYSSDSYTFGIYGNGNYNVINATPNVINGQGLLTGKYSGCYRNNGADTYEFYHVLIAR